MPVYLLGTLDTKGPETAFVRDLLSSLGVATRIINTGCLGQPTITADVPRETVFQAAGTSLEALRQANDRGQAVSMAALGVSRLMTQWHAAGQVSGVMALGGSAGTTIGTAAMRALPIGVPKVMVSTLASGQVRHYVGDKDILMLNSVVDILGINRISRLILGEAARAMAGMVLLSRTEQPSPSSSAVKDRPLVAATMFGVTTPCIMRAKEVLEAAGCEILVFHATGNGGQAMESLISDGLIDGVLDVTTTELADELVGGILSAGPERLTAAGKRGIPQVISVGATDMVNFGPMDSVPEKFRGRKLHRHNANVTLMRTTVDENRQLGEWIGRCAAASTGPTTLILPLKGVSAIDQPGQPFDDPAAREALSAGVHSTRGSVPIIELDEHVNSPTFAETAARTLLKMMNCLPTSP